MERKVLAIVEPDLHREALVRLEETTGYRYFYYGCRKRRSTGYDKRVKEHSCPSVKARWLEELIWSGLGAS